MKYTAGIDVGSTYTKAVVMHEDGGMAGSAVERTGFQLTEISERVLGIAAADAGVAVDDIAYIVATGFGRHQVVLADVKVTDLTAAARGCARLYPGTRTILDVGGQTMKASLLTDTARVKSFRLNDKCAAGTGAFLEKTARYMGYTT